MGGSTSDALGRGAEWEVAGRPLGHGDTDSEVKDSWTWTHEVNANVIWCLDTKIVVDRRCPGLWLCSVRKTMFVSTLETRLLTSARSHSFLRNKASQEDHPLKMWYITL